MKKGILLGVLMLTGGFGWCEGSAPADEKSPVSATSDATSVAEKNESVVDSEALAPNASEELAESNKTEKPTALAPVAEKPNEEPVIETVGPAKTELAPAVAKTNPSPADEKPAGRVALLQKISVFHEKEVASVQEMIARWNVTLKPFLARQQSLKEDLANKRAQLQSLEKDATKTARKEAKSLKKEVSGIEKLIQSIQKDIGTQYKSMGNEMKIKADLTEKSFQDTVRTVLEGLQSPLK
ncbi:MAG: hypothetical protein IPN19_07330 [Elusimicrobia bacterium]|nr:hypothetical protein [Elusimicrobiota bacterium]